MEERSVTTDWTKTKVSPEVTLIWPRSPVSVSRLKVSLMAGCQEARAGPATVPRRHRSPSMALTRLVTQVLHVHLHRDESVSLFTL